MNESILNSIKNLLGIDKELTAFDEDIIFGINSALFTLYQIGVGDKAYHISSQEDTWQDFIKDYDEVLSLIKSYVYIKVKQTFDPPTSSFVLESLSRQIAELEWRIQIQVDVPKCVTKKTKKCKPHIKDEECSKPKPVEDDKEPIPDIVIEELWNEKE